MNYVELAKQYSKAGYSVIPVTAEKIPAIRNWGVFQTRSMTDAECEQHFKNCWGIALLMGGAKGLSAQDWDLKYDLSGDLFDRFKQQVPVELLKKLYVQSTKNGGFHLVFSCKKVEPNQKLANRYTTDYEKHQVYMEAFNNPNNRSKALKMALNHKSLVLAETRGGTESICGGYIVISPSPGYKHVFGKIQEISVEEYDLLMETARSFNEVIEERTDIRLEKYKEWKLSPFHDYNERADVLELLINNGWEEVRNGSGNSIRVRRPGSCNSQGSALFDPETRKFNIFSTSTSLEVNRGYKPSDLFIELECEGDTSLAFRKLVDLGYGEEK